MTWRRYGKRLHATKKLGQLNAQLPRPLTQRRHVDPQTHPQTGASRRSGSRATGGCRRVVPLPPARWGSPTAAHAPSRQSHGNRHSRGWKIGPSKPPPSTLWATPLSSPRTTPDRVHPPASARSKSAGKHDTLKHTTKRRPAARLRARRCGPGPNVMARPPPTTFNRRAAVVCLPRGPPRSPTELANPPRPAASTKHRRAT